MMNPVLSNPAELNQRSQPQTDTLTHIGPEKKYPYFFFLLKKKSPLKRVVPPEVETRFIYDKRTLNQYNNHM